MENLLLGIKNKFWKDTIESAMKLGRECKITHYIQVHNTPLWYNSQLELEYRKSWVERGCFIIKDILNEFGELMIEAELNNKGLKIHFLDYEKLRFRI